MSLDLLGTGQGGFNLMDNNQNINNQFNFNQIGGTPSANRTPVQAAQTELPAKVLPRRQ